MLESAGTGENYCPVVECSPFVRMPEGAPAPIMDDDPRGNEEREEELDGSNSSIIDAGSVCIEMESLGGTPSPDSDVSSSSDESENPVLPSVSEKVFSILPTLSENSRPSDSILPQFVLPSFNTNENCLPMNFFDPSRSASAAPPPSAFLPSPDEADDSVSLCFQRFSSQQPHLQLENHNDDEESV
jgi:hypothetical protein